MCFVRVITCKQKLFLAVPQVINNTKDLTINILSSTFTVINCDKIKNCMPHQVFKYYRISSGYKI